MARKDVELVIRAKDEAAKVVDAITKAVNSFVDAQSDLQKTADKSDSALTRLGSSIGDLERQLRGSNVGTQIARSLESATKASDRLEQSVNATTAELTDLKKRADEAAASVLDLNAAAAKSGDAIRKQAKALAEAKAQAADLNKTLRDSVAERDRLVRADARLTEQIAKQEARLAAAGARYEKLAAEIAKTAEPTATLQARMAAADAAGQKLATGLGKLDEKQAAVRAGIEKTGAAVLELGSRLEQANAAFAKQGQALATSRQEYAELVGAAKAASAQQKVLETSAEQTAESLDRQQEALKRSQAEMIQLASAAKAADAGLDQLATGSSRILQQNLEAAREAARKTRTEMQGFRTDANALAAAMGIIGPPTREQVVALGRLTIALDAAEKKYTEQLSGLRQLQAVFEQTATDVDQLRTRQQAFVAIQGQVAAAVGKIEQEARDAGVAYDRLAVAAEKAGRATREGIRPQNVPPAKPINDLAEAYRRLYGESRTAMSWTQRLRGEVLSLISAYGGIYGVINLLGQTITAYQTLEAATSRLNAVFQGDQGAVANELDFIRRNADRLGVSFGQMADEYGKFSVATQGTNLEGENTRKIFISVAEAGRVNKLSMEQMKGVFTALTQIVSKGKVQMEELRQQLGDRLPGAIQIMADALGVGTDELFKMVEAGEVGSDSLVKFAEELDKRFGSQLGAALKTTTTALGQFQNAAFQALVTFGEAGFIEAFTNLLRDLTATLQSADFVAFIQRMSGAVSVLIDALGILVKNFDLVVIAASAFVGIKLTPFIVGIVAQLTTLRASLVATQASMVATSATIATAGTTAGVAAAAFTGLAAAVRALMSATGVGLVITAIAVGIGYWATRADEATDALVSHRNTVDKVKNAYDAAGGSAEKFAAALKDVSAAKIRNDLVGLRSALEDLGKPVGLLESGSNKSLAAELNRANEMFVKGKLPLDEYRKRLDLLAAANPSEWMDDFISKNIDLAEKMDAARRKIDEAEASLKLLKDPTDKAALATLGYAESVQSAEDASKAGATALGKYNEAIEKLKEAVPELAEELKKLKALAAIDLAYQEAINMARSIGEANQAYALRQQAISALDSGQYADAVKALGSFTSGLEAAAALVRKKEGFRATPYFDVNAYRVGFGSDTITLADGTIQKVVQGMRVSVADANRDLVRRIGEFQNTIRGQIGAESFNGMTPQQQAALTSIAYNYGDLPDRLVTAIKSGTNEDIVAAIKALGSDNAGINQGRRNEEAAIFSAGTSPEAVEAQIKANEKLLEQDTQRKEKADEYNESLAQRLEQQRIENENGGRLTEAAFVQKALYEEQQRAKQAGVELSAAEVAKIKELAAAEYQRTEAARGGNAEKTKANEALAYAVTLQQQQATLEREMAAARESGDSARFTTLSAELEQVNGKLREAIDSARAMWEAIGGPAADKAIAKLDTLSVKSQVTATKMKVDWSQVAQMFASGLTNAIMKFVGAVAQGEDAAEAAKNAFLEFAANFLLQIAQMILQQAILNALQGLFGGTSFGKLIGVGHTGGVVGSSRIGSGNASRRVSPSLFAGAMRLHNGGVPGLRPNEVPAILKKNEEVLTRSDPRHVLNGGGQGAASSEAGGTRITMINAIDSGDFVSQGMQTRKGERAFINFLRVNAGAVRRAIEV